MKQAIIIILLLSSVCFGDIYTSHQNPITDSTLDIGTSTLLWRYIYGDSFTDGTALWESSNLSGFNSIYGTIITGETLTDGIFSVTGGIISSGIWQGTAIDISDYTNLVAGTNITLVDDTLNVDDVFTVSSAWEIDTNDNWMPIVGTFNDPYFDIDISNNITVKQNIYFGLDTNNDLILPLLGSGTVDFSAENLLTSGGVTAGGTIEAATITESGNAVYNSTETPGGSLGGTWASPTIDDLFIKLVGDTTGAMTEDLNLDGSTLVISYDDNKVGIGTASPVNKLEVYGGRLRLRATDWGVSGNGGIRFTDIYGNSTTYIYPDTGNSLKIDVTGQSEALTIAASGKVGIGITPNSNIGLYINNDTGVFPTGISAWGKDTDGDAYGGQFYASISNTGDNVGCYAYAANAGSGNAYPFKDVYGNYSDASGWHDVSDPAMKTNIRDLTQKDVSYFYNLLDGIEVKGYRYKAELKERKDETPERFGMMANELPDFLTGKDKKGISAGRIVSYLIPIIQYQKKEIELLKEKIETLVE